jgi:hypothetical protein
MRCFASSSLVRLYLAEEPIRLQLLVVGQFGQFGQLVVLAGEVAKSLVAVLEIDAPPTRSCTEDIPQSASSIRPLLSFCAIGCLGEMRSSLKN